MHLMTACFSASCLTDDGKRLRSGSSARSCLGAIREPRSVHIDNNAPLGLSLTLSVSLSVSLSLSLSLSLFLYVSLSRAHVQYLDKILDPLIG